MADRTKGLFFKQLKAMLKRNIILKKREKRRTITEILMPIYYLLVLIVIKLAVPDPNMKAINTPKGEENLFRFFNGSETAHKIAYAPNKSSVVNFVREIQETWKSVNSKSKLDWIEYKTEKDLQTAYKRDPKFVPLAVIFDSASDPNQGQLLKYQIRTNPDYVLTPTSSDPSLGLVSCRGDPKENSKLEDGSTCKSNTYYFSGFLALQTLIDYTKLRLEKIKTNIPDIALEIFPKAAEVGSWSILLRLIIPFYMIIALSQFITYLMILIVGEKEKKIKEGMRLMGLMDSVFWSSWFIIYAIFVIFVSIVCILLLYYLKAFIYSNHILIFIVIVLYGFSLIMFAFMITPFFDKARTAGVVSAFMIPISGLLYFLQIFVSSKNPQYLWAVSLISPAGFGLAIDKVIMLDIQGLGITLSNLWDDYDSGLAFGISIIILLVDIVLYGVLAYYLDNVIPSEYGVKRSPLFCLMPSFWISKRSQMPSETPSENEDIEPVPRNMQNKEAIRIIDISKRFWQFRKPNVVALNGINLSIYEGQITAILGHNGAGKTTLFNILTGLSSPSSGTAFTFGLDIRNSKNMNKIRKMTGICPQHDILFDNLTAGEHLEFFAKIKGISDIKAAVNRTIRQIDLVDKINTKSKFLSGGQKRKLSVGIALIGDPKIIILDEPTSGVDPYSRRHLWNVLQGLRSNKVILLTTHFMDEADILADRKAVISKGKVRCCGSSLFLKNKFGVGYHLTLVLENVAREDSITQLVTRYVRTAKKDRRHGKELSYILPHNTVDNFSSLFAAIENEISNRSNLGIASYGVSMTTLEEVFLRLQKEEQEAEHEQDSNRRTRSRNVGAPPEITRSKQLQSSSDARTPENEALTERSRTLETVRCTPSTMQNIKTLIHLRILRLRRDWSKLIMALLLPNLIAFMALSLNRNNDIQHINIPKTEPIQLNIHMYNFQNISVYNGDNSEYLTKFKDQLEKLVVLDTYNGKFSSLLDIAPHLAAFNFKSFSSTSQSIAVLYNDTFVHNLPILVNLISNAFYRTVTPLAEISVSAHPFVNTAGADPPVGVGSLILGMIFIFAPIILAVDMVYDREIKARNQLRVNGLSFTVYFISFFVVQVALMVIITAGLIIIIYLLKPPSLSSGSSIIVLTLLVIAYCPASVLIFTCISYIFDKADTAMSVMPNLAMLFGIVPYIPVMYSEQKLASIIHYVFTCIDIMYVPYGMLHYIQKVNLKCKIDDHCKEPSFSNFMIPEIIIIFIALLVQIPLWFLFLLMADVIKSGGQVLSIFRSKKPRPNIEDANETIGLHEDQDVKNEKQRVKQLIRDPRSNRTVVTVDNLRKVYKKGEKGHMFNNLISSRGNLNVAIKSFSLAIDASEVFGLLGHNGAGKTTTLKIITAEESPTRGRVQIAGKNIVSNVNAVFQFLGYCPQYDAQWKDITVEEHLELYSRIRGVPDDFIEPTIDFYLTGLQLKEHKDKRAEKCSGGTKRKLSYAMAMVGNPKIVLLDEPSTGMDPQSKRFLWDTILSNFRGSKGAILTTHSMEEADALCSRIGIMVKGELRCLGSTQHLKNLYGAGYTLEIKLASEGAGDTEEKFRALKNFVFDLFPNAVLQDTFGDRLIFSVPQDSIRSLARCFRSLENAKRSLNIEEYSFSQTTLEQVFIKFAQEGEQEED